MRRRPTNVLPAASLALALALTLALPLCLATSEPLVAEHPYLVGTWASEAPLMNRERTAECGPIEVEFTIIADGGITVRIGKAEALDPEIEVAKFGFLVSGTLKGPIKAGKPLNKPHASILLVLPDEGRESITTSEANLHMKSNRVFNIGIYNGGMTQTPFCLPAGSRSFPRGLGRTSARPRRVTTPHRTKWLHWRDSYSVP